MEPKVNTVSWWTDTTIISALIGLGGAIVGAGIGAIVSYMTSKSATKASINAQYKAEEIRELQTIRENALIVYYDLFLGLNDIKKLYMSKVSGDNTSKPHRMYFSNDWIKNVAAISKRPEIRERVSYIYSLYGYLLTVKDNLETYHKGDMIKEPFVLNKQVYTLIEKLFSNPFNEFCNNRDNAIRQEAIWNNKKNSDLDINEDLCEEMKNIMKQLKSMSELEESQ